jgi:transcription elongation factor Elf1
MEEELYQYTVRVECPSCGAAHLMGFDQRSDQSLMVVECRECGLEYGVRPVFTMEVYTYTIKRQSTRTRRKKEG